jgi:hypothetical protein
MMHSPDGGNSCTGKPANLDASNVGTTNEHAKQGNERHTMANPDDRLINARDCELAGFDLAAVLDAAKHGAP